MIDHINHYFDCVDHASRNIDLNLIDGMVEGLANCKGRVYIIGLGGSAGNASHMVNDLRKLCKIKAYTPTDNVSEFSAWVNDSGVHQSFVSYLINEQFGSDDILFVLSVGGGSIAPPISEAIVQAVLHAKSQSGKVFGIVGKADGVTAQQSDIVIVINQADERLVTPISEAFQGIVWHAIVSDPRLQKRATTW